jgi:hypothetical protein
VVANKQLIGDRQLDRIQILPDDVVVTVFDRGNLIDVPLVMIGLCFSLWLYYRRVPRSWLLVGSLGMFALKVCIPYAMTYLSDATRFRLHDIQAYVGMCAYVLLVSYVVMMFSDEYGERRVRGIGASKGGLAS